MEETKPWYLSRGVIGSLAAVIAGIVGIWYTGIDKEHIEAVATSGASFVGGILSLIGRVKASKKIA